MPKEKNKTSIRIATANSDAGKVEEALQLANAIAKVQGNIFIKELLRSKKKDDSTIRIGITKDEILDNLRTAISDGKITHADLTEWVDEVEGWGKQHVYLYNVKQKLAGNSIWDSADTFLKHLKLKQLEKEWKKAPGLYFPEELELAHIDFADGTLECVWRRGVILRQRDKTQDKTEVVINGDTYDFQAYRHTPTRSVMRFEMSPQKKVAGLFVQIPLGPEHHEAIKSANELLDKLFDRTGLTEIDISKAIKTLDREELEELEGDEEKKSYIQAQSTKFSTDGANVEFSADSELPGGWPAVAAVRQVRKALKEDKFDGNSGKFVISLKTKEGLTRDITMSLIGYDKRLYLHAQMTAEEVFQTLAVVRKYAAP
jgi:hypothetical protein